MFPFVVNVAKDDEIQAVEICVLPCVRLPPRMRVIHGIVPSLQ